MHSMPRSARSDDPIIRIESNRPERRWNTRHRERINTAAWRRARSYRRGRRTVMGHGLPPLTPVGGSAMVRSADLAGTFRRDKDAPIAVIPVNPRPVGARALIREQAGR